MNTAIKEILVVMVSVVCVSVYSTYINTQHACLKYLVNFQILYNNHVQMTGRSTSQTTG